MLVRLAGFLAHPVTHVLIGFILGLLASQYNDWRRARAKRRALATALVFEMRRARENLKDLQTALKSNAVIYSSDFTDQLFLESQLDISEFGGEVYLPTSTFFAQLRNINFLRSEFRRWNEKILAGGRGPARQQRQRCGQTLVACVQQARDHCDQALAAMKSNAIRAAYIAPLPQRTYTEEEQYILGVQDTDSTNE